MTRLDTGLHYPLKLESLPKSWKAGYVADFARRIEPGFASGKHNKFGEGIPHLRPFNVSRQGKVDLSEIKSVAPGANSKRLQDGDVLFNNTNSPELIGKTAVVTSPGDWGFSNHMTRIRFRDDVLPTFAAYQLHFLWMTGYFLYNCVKHVNQASVSSKKLAGAVPFVAPSIEQQKEIVEEIEKQFSRLDKAVTNLHRVNANLKRYKAAVLNAAVEGRLVEIEAELARREGRTFETGEHLLQRIIETRRSQWKGKGKYKEPAARDTTDLPELPEGWVWVSWEMVLERTDAAFKRGPFGSALTKTIFVEKGYKVYEQYCPINDDCSFARYYITPEKFEELRAFEVQAGDYLISCSGVTLGRITRVPQEFEPGIINQALLRVRINEAFINNQYFLYLFRSAPFQKSIFDNSTGSAIPNVKGVKELKAMAIQLPSLAEQKRIVAEIDRRLSLQWETEAQVDANLQRAARLRQSILDQAFSGGLLREDGLSEVANSAF